MGSIFNGAVLFIVIWWVVFFTILPVGVQSDEEAGHETVKGTVSSAPVKHNLGKKVLATTGISSCVGCLVVCPRYRVDLYLLRTAVPKIEKSKVPKEPCLIQRLFFLILGQLCYLK